MTAALIFCMTTLLCPPRMTTTPPPQAPLSERLLRLRGSFARLSPAQREVLVLGGTFLFGLLVMPFIIWIAGNRVLGPYTHGDNLRAGPWALFSDYVVGLAHGSAVFWMVALGPTALLLLVRGFLALLWLVPQLRRPGPEAGNATRDATRNRGRDRPPSAFN